MLQEVSDDSNDSLFGEDDTLGEEACLLHSPAPASVNTNLLSQSAPPAVSKHKLMSSPDVSNTSPGQQPYNVELTKSC